MTSLLHLSASSRGDASNSRRGAARLLGQIGTGSLRVIERDLASQPLPHPDRATVEASLMPPEQRGPAEHAALALSETLIAELESADAVLISTPMHNFTVPSALKAWIDLVVRPNRTFLNTPAGKVGMLANRPVLAVVSCGGSFRDSPGSQDFLSPYLKYVFAAIGITQVEVMRMERMNWGPDFAQMALDSVRVPAGWPRERAPA
ncbi:(Acyl-carrier protein) phosphodiesterase [Cupriavidus taiwanensis]|uniref:FMN dependent NADH:quinone oxidoreductase n=1 Tax=Cupriavidus taiwanensis TaxID=164546 RepID=A0A375CF19_9BURK|nr:NAD(P)H-dependent oxidoreductase [Cupriavidus taiwanensis]SOY68603.1 (Acyl-carrier protein) phosphodiesterase [Cupriavidus taiwanensis]